MHIGIWFAIAIAGGGFLTSLIEYKLDYNLIDKVLDVFRSAESKAAALDAKVKTKL